MGLMSVYTFICLGVYTHIHIHKVKEEVCQLPCMHFRFVELALGLTMCLCTNARTWQIMMDDVVFVQIRSVNAYLLFKKPLIKHVFLSRGVKLIS
jgi:hypothetical protein